MSEMTIKPPYGYMLVTDPDEKKEDNWKYQNWIGKWKTVCPDGKRSDFNTYAKPIPAPEGYELVTDMDDMPHPSWKPVWIDATLNGVYPLCGTIGEAYELYGLVWFKPITNTVDQEQINTRTAPSFEGWIYVRVADGPLDIDKLMVQIWEEGRLCAEEEGLDFDGLIAAARKTVAKYGPSKRTSEFSAEEIEYLKNADSTSAGGPLYRKVEQTCPHCKGTGKVQE